MNRQAVFYGDDVSHWIQAERELATSPEVQESGNTYTVAIRVPDIPAEQIKVCATEVEAVIAAQTNSSKENTANAQDGNATDQLSLYYMVRWPKPIDTASCKAELTDGTLTLSSRKAQGDVAGTSDVSAAGTGASTTARRGARQA